MTTWSFLRYVTLQEIHNLWFWNGDLDFVFIFHYTLCLSRTVQKLFDFVHLAGMCLASGAFMGYLLGIASPNSGLNSPNIPKTRLDQRSVKKQLIKNREQEGISPTLGDAPVDPIWTKFYNSLHLTDAINKMKISYCLVSYFRFWNGA